jgi:hypothetical protein
MLENWLQGHEFFVLRHQAPRAGGLFSDSKLLLSHDTPGVIVLDGASAKQIIQERSAS